MLDDFSLAQTGLPEITVRAPKEAPARRTATPRRVVRRAAPAPQVARQAPVSPPPSPEAVLASKTTSFDTARNAIFAPTATSSYQLGQQAIASLPQGENTPLDRVLLTAPGVTQDSAASGLIHVRNEHGNVQYRINGIMLPDGVAGFGQMLESSFVANMALITGALPAQYGLRTAGVVDITAKSGAALAGGSVNIYGGSRETLTPWFEYGGSVAGKTDYYFSGRFFSTNEGIENPTASLNPIHDDSTQWRGFGYVSTFLDDFTRVSFLTGAQTIKYQIPNNPGQPVGMSTFPVTSAFGITNFDSANLDERQYETNVYQVLAWQRSIDGFDVQLSYFNRNSTLHFVPDPVGDLLINGVASDVSRSAFTSGIQGDGAYRVNGAHTVHAGFTASGEYTDANNASLVEACTNNPCISGDSGNEPPFSVYDSSTKLGWLLGVYLSDEWKLTDQLTLNVGARFDQMYQYIDANQLSPRVSLQYKPFDWTTFHIGYARYFTPPTQATAAPVNIALFNGTTGQAFCTTPGPGCTDPVKPERSHYFDAGINQTLMPGLEAGVDAYYKLATDLLDDGQFGQAYVLTAFNYAKAYNYGVELSGKYTSGPFTAYANWAWAVQMGTGIDSQQYLIDPASLAYIANNYIYTDHAQTYTASAGLAYRFWEGTRVSTDMIYGSGLRTNILNPDGTVAVPNGDHVAPYAQFNAGIAHEFNPGGNLKPVTVRFDVVNVFDTIYQIRSGSGIGVFAPQYGPRRGYFIGVSEKL